MKTIIRIYNRKTKKFIKEIKEFNKPETLFRNWILEKKTENKSIENLLIEASNNFIGFFHYITGVDEDMLCGKVEIAIKNKKPHVICKHTNILFEYSCDCCLDVKSISRDLVFPEYEQLFYQYYMHHESGQKFPVSVFNKIEYSFLETSYWQTILIKEMKNIYSKKLIGLS